jgi:predicted dehydrogenase
MAAPKRIGLVGCGRWGRAILRDLLALGATVDVVDPAEEAQHGALAAGARSTCGHADALPAVDGIVVAATTTRHAEIIARLIGRGVPIFCEKPLCVDPDQAQALAAVGKDRLFVMDKWRYHPGVEMLARLARSGRLGRPLGLHTLRLQHGHAHADVDASWILAPHDLSIALEILGAIPPPRAAVADGAGGLIATLGVAPWLVLEVSTRHETKRRSIRLVGSEAVAVLDDGAPWITIRGGGAGPERIATPGPPPLQRELACFLDHLGGGPPPRSSAAEGAHAVAVVAELRALAGRV